MGMDSLLQNAATTPIKLTLFVGDQFMTAGFHSLGAWMCCLVNVERDVRAYRGNPIML